MLEGNIAEEEELQLRIERRLAAIGKITYNDFLNR